MGPLCMKNDLKKLIDSALPNILTELGLEHVKPEDIRYDIEIPKNKGFGDLAANTAFQLGRMLKRNPLEIAQISYAVIEKIIQKDSGWKKKIKKITIEKPGFINFFLTETSVVDHLLDIARLNEAYGRSNAGAGQKAMVEFVSANPTGPLTIAHGRQAALGDTLARILDAVGYKVHREFYLNDRGRQIRLLGESLLARVAQSEGKQTELPEDGYQGAYLIELAKTFTQDKKAALSKIKSSEEAVGLATEYAIRFILIGIQKDLSDLGVRFDEYFSERSLADKNLIDETLETLRKNNFLFEAEGALWFRSTQFGDDKDRVLKKQTGEYTYLAPDIAYHKNKFDRGFTKLINLWGPDHHGYIPRLKAACQALGYDPGQLHILIVQLTTLYRHGEPVRMSTRAGEFVTLRELMDEVGVDAARFFFLMRKVDTHLDFDLELAKEKSQDNPVYYLQYAHARISSILAFADRAVDSHADISLIAEEEALDLIKKMSQYPEVLKEAAFYLEPYRVADYLRELAAFFHKFYAHHRVVTEDEAATKARLFLTDCVRIVLRNGLGILGVSAPQKM